MFLICLALAIGQELKPLMVVLLLPLIPVTALLALGLLVAPGRQRGRRLALVGLCSGLRTLFVGIVGGTALCSSRC